LNKKLFDQLNQQYREKKQGNFYLLRPLINLPNFFPDTSISTWNPMLSDEFYSTFRSFEGEKNPNYVCKLLSFIFLESSIWSSRQPSPLIKWSSDIFEGKILFETNTIETIQEFPLPYGKDVFQILSFYFLLLYETVLLFRLPTYM